MCTPDQNSGVQFLPLPRVTQIPGQACNMAAMTSGNPRTWTPARRQAWLQSALCRSDAAAAAVILQRMATGAPDESQPVLPSFHEGRDPYQMGHINKNEK